MEASSKKRIPPKHGKKYVDSLTEPGYYRFKCSPDCASSKCSPPIGFGVRVTPGGKKLYIVERKVNGKCCRASIDYHGGIAYDEAFVEAEKLSAQMGKGINPNDEEKKARATEEKEQQRQSVTLLQAFQDCYNTRRKTKSTTCIDYEKKLKLGVPDWLDRPLVSITEQEVIERYTSLSNKIREKDDYRPTEWNGTGLAEYVKRVLKAVFNFAMNYPHYKTDGEPLIRSNPILVLNVLDVTKSVKSRKENYIPIEKVNTWYQSLCRLQGQDTARDCVRLVLLTGLRIEAARTIKWSNVTFDHKAKSGFFIAEEKGGDSEKKNEVVIPLTPSLYELLRTREKKRKNEFVFPGNGKSKHLEDVRKAIWNANDLAGTPWQDEHPARKSGPNGPHELRRTFGNIAHYIGFDLAAIQDLMHHAPNTVTAINYVSLHKSQLLKRLVQIEDFILAEFAPEEPNRSNSAI